RKPRRRGAVGVANWPDSGGAPEHEVDRSAHAERSPEIVEPHWFLHIERGEGHEDAQRDDFLEDLELAELQLGVADAVGGHLEQVLEQRDPPAHERRHDPWLLAEM